MKTIRTLTLTALVATTGFFGVAHAGTQAKGNDIVAVASSAGSFNTLVAAVKAAGLVETLQGPGPFTVFAPTDEAFAKLPKGTLEELLKPENKEKLVGILTYHVVPGKVMAADVKTDESQDRQRPVARRESRRWRRHGGQRQGHQDRRGRQQRRHSRH